MNRGRYLLTVTILLALVALFVCVPAGLEARGLVAGGPSLQKPLVNLAQRAPAATGVVAGTVTAEGGSPLLEGIRVRLYLQQTDPTDWDLYASAFTGADGTYAINGLPTGTYRAEFSDPAGAYATEYYDDSDDFTLATNFSVTDGETTGGIDAALAPAGAISGTVTEVDSGDAIADIVVTAWFLDGGVWKPGLSGLTNGAGFYTIEGLLPDTYRIRFRDAFTPARYLTEYYDDAATVDTATDVVVDIDTVSGIDAVLAPSGLVAIAVPLDASVSGDDVLLEWAHNSANENYAIYRDGIPYFNPPDGTLLTTVDAATTSYPDSGALLDGVNYYYVVRALCCSGTSWADSNYAGVFHFDLEPGMGP